MRRILCAECKVVVAAFDLWPVMGTREYDEAFGCCVRHAQQTGHKAVYLVDAQITSVAVRT